jgi:signal transduction histidine kinase
MIWLVEDGSAVLRACTSQELCGKQVESEDGLVGQAITTGAPVSASFKDGLPEGVKPDLEELAEYGAALIVPFFSGEKRSPETQPLGAFGVYSAQDAQRDFDQSEWDKKVLSILGHYAALALENAARQQALQAAQEQRAIAEAFAAVGDIASNLMHRLNNKIGTIPVRIEGIEDKSRQALESDTYLRSNLEEIGTSARQAIEIVSESLYHLRPIHFTNVCIAESVAAAIRMVNIPDEVQLHLEALDELPCINAGARRLSLVFVNLIENAIDAMQAQGTITISGRSEADWIRVQVYDTGPGIPPESQERIFEFNYSSRSGDTPGKLGFGLWWVKTLLARLGGNIRVESDGLSGTTFWIDLPRSQETE